ncbi:hypothetical protein THRCLA_22414 [Thraustotheca clavata]|uniref:Uncharacterized protein n=1 Tax=Thraustotheca clavata TaxID=74557 RepID=A0A1V9Z249_9STRA|nr:hypothetical protein THRCLA_22414 [Thraustotheca clavata]
MYQVVDFSLQIDSMTMENLSPKKTKLCVGEMVLVDTFKNSRQHHLKYQVCQVVRMEFGSDDEVIINVQLYKRSHEQSQGVLRARKVFSIQHEMIKRKVCLLSLYQTQVQRSNNILSRTPNQLKLN